MSTTPRTSATAGEQLPSLTIGPITRADLALYAGPSGDYNPIHIDVKVAQAAGLDDVFAHGMLSMGYLGRVLSQWCRPEQLREYGVRFQAITPVEATVRCSGTVEDVFEEGGARYARVALEARIDDDTVTLAGSALVALDG